jgi:hypothetical protein
MWSYIFMILSLNDIIVYNFNYMTTAILYILYYAV